MDKSDAESYFEKYREYLFGELGRLASYVRLYRRLHERKADRLKEMNIAPAFFSTTVDALFSAIILWVDKLFGDRSERGLLNFLTFVEHNRKVFDIKELQRRKNYPYDHWMLQNREPVTFASIQHDRKRIAEFSLLKSFSCGAINSRHILTKSTFSKGINFIKMLRLPGEIWNRSLSLVRKS